VKLIVVACNSATATALGELQQTLEVPVIGVLRPRRGRRCSSRATAAWGCGHRGDDRDGRYRELVHSWMPASRWSGGLPGLADAIQRGGAYGEPWWRASAPLRGAA
jgi:glutamate racemase